MGRFVNKATQVVFTVDDSKDKRYASEQFAPADAVPEKKAPAKKAAAKSDK